MKPAAWPWDCLQRVVVAGFFVGLVGWLGFFFWEQKHTFGSDRFPGKAVSDGFQKNKHELKVELCPQVTYREQKKGIELNEFCFI